MSFLTPGLGGVRGGGPPPHEEFHQHDLSLVYPCSQSVAVFENIECILDSLAQNQISRKLPQISVLQGILCPSGSFSLAETAIFLKLFPYL